MDKSIIIININIQSLSSIRHCESTKLNLQIIFEFRRHHNEYKHPFYVITISNSKISSRSNNIDQKFFD